MPRARTLFAALALLIVAAAAADAVDVDNDEHVHDDSQDISDEQFYEMPQLFHLDHYEECLARRGVYCVGSFELASTRRQQRLFRLMQRYSSNWVDNFNHTRLHRGLCVSRRCPAPTHPAGDAEPLHAWFASCVNASMMSSYELSARLYRLEYCERGGGGSGGGGGSWGGRKGASDLSASEQAFAGVIATLLVLALVSTVLDVSLTDQTKKNMDWALAWSVRGSWRALLAAPGRAGAGGDLAALDGLRVLGMLCVIVEHVCWLNTLTYLLNPRRVAQMRRDTDVQLMSNSTLMVQAFFLMSSFLLANKLLQQRRRQQPLKPFTTFAETMINRFIRMSPTYFLVVWFAASGWERLGSGPLWAPLVGGEAAVCRRKWWTHLLYLNNIIYPDDKCLIQTWYLAADMQLYLVALALTLSMRGRRGALAALAALLALSTALVAGLAYYWHLVPTYVLHRPEAVRALYRGSASFNAVYQSPLGNAPGALAGLLLAHLTHQLREHYPHLHLGHYRWFRWLAWWAPWLALAWIPGTARLAGLLPAWRGGGEVGGPAWGVGGPAWGVGGPAWGVGGPAWDAAGAALVAGERVVFALLVAAALLGAMHGVQSPVRSVLSWRGWAVLARLSYGALLLHMIINKSLLAARLGPAQLDRPNAILEWFGVAVASYLAALPLALLVEIPVQRLYRALRATTTAASATATATAAVTADKANM
ncbi:unnamed protein product [Chilo suppressalis]|uniref:Acyltransferase 3 domain-containing protein n=1 Tax=Chilo suppressalis TaxID=168631 RepID=A0ABN8L4L8_CHISP|nr:unnamed protein product [Chilo suppressalis]